MKYENIKFKIIKMATKLQVGESIYYVDKQKIIDKFPDCLLTSIFKEKPDSNEYFIDRDGELFKYILSYLRSYPFYNLPNDPNLINRLHKEASYYNLTQFSHDLARNAEKCGIRIGNDFASYVTMLVKYVGHDVSFVFSFNADGKEFTETALKERHGYYLVCNIGAFNKRGYKLERIDNISDNQGEKKLYTFKLIQE